MIKGIRKIVASVGPLLSDFVAEFKSPIADNTLRTGDGSDLSLVLQTGANPGDTSLVLQSAGGVDIAGTIRGETALTFGGETVNCKADTSPRLGLLYLDVITPVVGTHPAGTAVTLSQVIVSDIAVSTISVEKAPRNHYATKLPEFGFVIARDLLPIVPSDGWTVRAVNKIDNHVLEGKLGKVTGGAANVHTWVGDPG